MLQRGTLCAVAGAALAGLFVFPTVAADEPFMGKSFSGKSFDAVFAICKVEARDEPQGTTRTVSIEPGMGDGGFAIAANPKAQAWFNYGIKMFHAFYHTDARLAFDQAVAADPHCAMCLWGQALSRGPTMNFDAEDGDMKAGLDMAKRAQTIARTPREKLLAAAMVRRYSRAQDASAERDFAAALIKADAMGPSTPDLRLIAAEATLTEFRRGDHTVPAAAIALIEPILRATPNNTAAIHYYIHATEMARQPATALPYAEKLAGLAPGASHLIHMAAHTYFRVGRYEDAATINAAAMRSDSDHLVENKAPDGLTGASYYEHNLNFGMAGSLMSGDRALGLKFADHLHRAFAQKEFDKDGMSYDEARRFTIYARYDPARLLTLPEPAAEGPDTVRFYHYARGEAFAALGDAKSLTAEIEKAGGGDDPAVKIAHLVLVGRLAMLQHRYTDAGHAFEDAAVLQDQLVDKPGSMDPPAFWYPVRRSAAAAWLQAGQYQQAADAAQKSLSVWQDDPLALHVLSQAEDRLGKTADAHRHDAQAIGLWMGDIGKVDIALM
jgi:tetratricopeptide (TPR) repeat protein